MFRALESRSVRWLSLAGYGQGEGVQHLTLNPVGESIIADAVVIGSIDGRSFGARFHVGLDRQWRMRRLDIETTDGRRLFLDSDGEGHWRSRDGAALPLFDGCVDIDLQGSPFTNTLPIRRLSIGPEHGTVSLDMLYIPFDSFEPYRFAQRYSCLQPGRLYRYENADGSFTADLPLDEDGLVTDYPGLFERV